MRKVTAYSVLLAIMIASSFWLHSFPHAFALIHYAPGVKVGDSVTYGEFSVNDTSPYPYFQANISTIAVQVRSVVATTNAVVASLVTTYRNGSQITDSLNGTTDAQTGNLLPYILAGGLRAGDPLWKNPNQYYQLSVNETVNRVYAGALRTVNLLNLTYQSSYQSVKASYYWDVNTGLLLEEYVNDSYNSQSGLVVLQIYFEATATNVWTPDSTPNFGLDASAQTSGPHLGEATSYRLDLTSLNLFNGTISLAESILGTVPTNPPSITLSSATISVSSQNLTASSILTFATNSSTPLGPYLISINATSGTIFHQAMIAVDLASPDYTITANPGNLTLSQGTSKNSTITVKSLGAFMGTVSLQAFPQFFNSLITTVLSTNSVELNSTSPVRTAILTVTAPLGAPPGTGGVNVNGVSGNIYRSTFIAVNVTGPDFRIAATPTFLTFKEGQSATSIISLTSILGFAGTVSLTSSTYGPVTATFTNNSLNLTAAGKASANLTLSTPASGPPGFYSVYVTGTSGNIQRSVYINLNVTGPDFRFTTSLYSVTLQAGQSSNATLTLTGLGGFSGTINLSTNIYGPISALVNPTSIALDSTRLSSTALLTVLVPAGAVPGFYSVSINAVSGNIVHSIYFSVQVIGPDFSISPNPYFLSLPQGGSGQSTIFVSSLNNFFGTVLLSTYTYPSQSLQLSLSSAILQLSAGGSASSTLTVQVPLTTAPGYYFVNLNANSGQLSHSTSVEVQVTGPDFSIFSSPSFLTLRQGQSANSTITVTSIDNFSAPLNITTFTYYSGLVSVSPRTTVLTPARNASLTTTFTFSTSANTPPGFYYFQITATGGNLTRYTNVQVDVTGPDFSLSLNPYSLTLSPGASATLVVSLASIEGFSGNVTLSASAFGLNATLANGLIHLASNGTAATLLTIRVPQGLQSNYYSVQVSAIGGIISRYAYISVQVVAPDFSVQSNQGSLFVSPGGSAQSTITVKSLNGFNGTVAFSTSGFLPAGLSATLDSSNVTLVAGGSAFVTLNVTASSSVTSQSFYLSIQATSGNLTRYTYVYVTVTSPDFSLSANPAFLSVPRGSSSTTSLIITSLYGFHGDVTLSASLISGISVSLAPQIVLVSSGGSVASNLSIAVPSSTPPGYYEIFVSATNGVLFRGTYVQVRVTGTSFTLNATPSFRRLIPGESADSSIRVSTSNGFGGTVELSATSFGLNATLLPQSLILNSTVTSATSVLTMTVPARTFTGYYAVSVTGSGDGFNQTVWVTVFVNAFDFSLLAQPASITVFQGGSNTSTISVSSINDFNGTVSLNTLVFPPDAGVAASLSTSILFVSSNHTSASMLTVSASSDAATGSYNVEINAVGTSQVGSPVVHSFILSVTVMPKPDFQISVSPASLSILQGSADMSTLSLMGLNSFSGTVALSTTVSLQGLSVSLTDSSVFVAGNLTADSRLIVSAGTNVVGYFTVTVTAQGGGVSHSLDVQVYVAAKPDFTLSSPPSFVYVQAGASASIPMTLSSLNGFVGSVQVFSAVSATDVLFTPNSLNVSLSSGETKSVTVTVAAAVTTGPGTYKATFTANATIGVHSTSLDLIVLPPPDFTLFANTGFLALQAGSSGSIVVTLRGLDGFVGAVQVSPVANATSVSFSPSVSTVSLSSGGTANTTFTLGTSVTTSPGFYSVTFSGNATAGVGVGVHSWTVLLQVLPPADFTLTVNTLGLIVASGTSATTTVSILPVNGFNGSVALSTSGGAGFTGSFSPNPVPGGIPSSYLTLSVASTVAAGNYTVTVTGTGGSFTHKVSFPVIVSASSKVSLTETQASYSHRVSVSKNGGVETWTFTVKNTGKTPTYVQAVTAANSTSSNLFFTLKTSVTLLAPEASLTFVLSQTFTSSSIGLKYNFRVNLFYGSGLDALGNIINPTDSLVTKGSFTVLS